MADYIPDNLQVVVNNNTPDFHRDAFDYFYTLLYINPYEQGRFRLEITFFELTDAQFEQLKLRYPNFEKRNPHSLYKLCQYVINSPAQTRQHNENLLALCTNEETNTRVIQWYKSFLIRDNENAPDPPLIDSIIQFANKVSTICAYLIKKTQKAKSFYTPCSQFIRETGTLQTQVSNMLLGLTPRNQIFATAQRIATWRDQASIKYREYLRYNLENLETALHILRGNNYNRNVHFVYTDFRATVQNKTVFMNHHYQVGDQVQDALTDPTLAAASSQLDNLISQIHSFTPDISELQNKKAERINSRITALDADFYRFQTGTQPTAAKAKILKTTCNFLLTELENLYLQGPQDHIASIPAAREVMEQKINYLDNYLTSLTDTKEQEAIENKAASNEISKTLSIVNLPKLKSPMGYLNWRANLERLFKHYKSDLSRMSLIRRSVIKQQDKYRLDTMKTHKEMLSYIEKIYGQLDYLLPLMFKRLSTLPPGNSDYQVLKNYEIFIQQVSLLKDNNLLDKLDRFLIETLVTKILTDTARSLYYRDMLLKEPDWKLSAEITPSDQETPILNTNNDYEKLRRDHFLQFAAESYETLRRISNNRFFEKQMKPKPESGAYSTEVKRKESEDCPFCSTSHQANLIKCPNFNKWTPKVRYQKFKDIKGYCRRCLEKVDFSKHKIKNNLCPNQERIGTCRKCQNSNHHTYLHLTREDTGQTKQNQPKKGQFKRDNRQARYSNSTKVNMTTIQEEDEGNEDALLELEYVEDQETVQVNCLTPQLSVANNTKNSLYLTCVTSSTIQGPDKTSKVLTLLDTASVFNFGTNSYLQSLGYKPIRFWNGQLKTLTQSHEVNLPVYLIDFILSNNEKLKIPVHGIDENIGSREKIHPALFSQIVKDAKQDKTFQNYAGDVKILLGLRSARLLGCPTQMPAAFVKKYPDLKVMSSSLSKQPFLTGFVKHSHASAVYSINSIQSNVVSVMHTTAQSKQ